MNYLDYAATTPGNAEGRSDYKGNGFFWNPSSVYRIGREQKQKIERVKKSILSELQASPHDAIISKFRF